MIPKKSKHFVFHHLLEEFRKYKLQELHLLVGVSGGLDSMTLLASLCELKSPLSLKISVVHVRHGAQNQAQKKFQNQARKKVEDFCQKNQLSFFEADPGEFEKKQNEAEMRTYRYQIFSQFLKESKAHFLVLAHTKEDLLETRLIRLIRGTGGQGLRAMTFNRQGILRPFIHLSRRYIKDYALASKLKWEEDPSNQSIDYSLRNWIRKKWLPQLEKVRSGSVETLARSLDLLVSLEEGQLVEEMENICQNLIRNQSLKRKLPFLFEDQKKILAYYFKKQGFKDYRTSHILELLKQMSRPQKKFSFSLLGKTWKMGPEWLAPGKEIC